MMYALVKVLWNDSTQSFLGWQDLMAVEAPETTMCISVGYLVGKTDEHITLAPNYALGSNVQDEQVSQLMYIPTCSITAIKILEEAGDIVDVTMQDLQEEDPSTA